MKTTTTKHFRNVILAYSFSLIVSFGVGLTQDGMPDLADELIQAENTAPTSGKSFTVSDGSRLEVAKKGFSIKPPIGWEVFLDIPNISLLLQAPYEKDMLFQRNIQVMTFDEPRYIDQTTSHEFAEIIERKFTQVAGGVSDYRIMRQTISSLGDGSEGILYYAEFTLKGQSLMHAHLLVSSATRHYLVTFTDLSENFKGENGSDNLTISWESMISIKLDSKAPSRLTVPLYLGGAIVAIIVLLVGLMLVRKMRDSSKLDFEDDDEDDEINAIEGSDHGDLVVSKKKKMVEAKKKKRKKPHRKDIYEDNLDLEDETKSVYEVDLRNDQDWTIKPSRLDGDMYNSDLDGFDDEAS